MNSVRANNYPSNFILVVGDTVAVNYVVVWVLIEKIVGVEGTMCDADWGYQKIGQWILSIEEKLRLLSTLKSLIIDTVRLGPKLLTVRNMYRQGVVKFGERSRMCLL